MKAIIFIILLLPFQLFSIDLYIANWNIYSDSPSVSVGEEEQGISNLIFANLVKYDFGGYLTVQQITSFSRYASNITKSTLDASELCEQTGIDFLIYGSLKQTETYYDAELRIWDNQKKEVRKIIYAKVGLFEFPLVAELLSAQTATYLKELFGITSIIKAGKEAYSGFYFQSGAGYWLPIGDWGGFLTGLFSIETGITLIPTIIPSSDEWNNFYFSVGLTASYNLGINQSGFEETFFHSILIRTPIELLWETLPQHIFKAGIVPIFQIDLMAQSRILNDGLMAVATGWGAGVITGYQFWFSESRDMAIGINPEIDFVFYNKLFIIPRCSIDYSLRLSGGSK
jgi:hypothetical protein